MTEHFTGMADYAFNLSESLLAEIRKLGGDGKFMRRTLPSRLMIAGLRFDWPGGTPFVFSSLPDGIRIWPGTGFDTEGFAPVLVIGPEHISVPVTEQVERVLLAVRASSSRSPQ